MSSARRPPGVVRAAAAVLSLMAIGGLAYGAIGLALMPGIVDNFQNAAAAAGLPSADIDGGTTVLRGVPMAAAFVSVVATVLLAVLAVGTLRGNPAVRIATWIVCALGLVSGGLAAVFGFVQQAGSFGDEAVLAAMGEAHPGWWPWTSVALSLLQALGYVVVALLLATPAANGYFRRTPAAGAPTPPPPPPVDPTDWQRPDPPATTPAPM
ncbi:hypothetical protein [Asanoa siamensis]|uniref:hypothetical protein n=1 Tax=Asanoa siamensis TaxID=926357 RepID=UPI001942A481|nr:hypothetical protein [Asanoa siamensis]